MRPDTKNRILCIQILECRKRHGQLEALAQSSPIVSGVRPNHEPRVAIAFYDLRMGDQTRLRTLLDVFDREAKQTGDHVVVELCG